jgi:transcriptional regulator with XRE-family HTH domain
MGARLRIERERLGSSQTAFAAIGGVTKVSQFNYETDKRNPDAAYLIAVEAIGVDVLFVLTGRRTPVAEAALSPDERDFIEKIRLLSPEDRAHVVAVVDAFWRKDSRAEDEE